MALQVGDLARRCGVSTDTVRYYTRRGLLNPRRNVGNRYRLFDEEDVRRLNFIQRAKNLGYMLIEIQQIFDESRRGNSPCPMVRDIIQRRIEENRKGLIQQFRLQERMEAALVQWKQLPDGVPNGNSICRLIESVDAGQDD